MKMKKPLLLALAALVGAIGALTISNKVEVVQVRYSDAMLSGGIEDASADLDTQEIRRLKWATGDKTFGEKLGVVLDEPDDITWAAAGLEISNVIYLAFTAKDASLPATTFDELAVLEFYLSDSSDCDSITADTPTSEMLLGTHGSYQLTVAQKMGRVFLNTSNGKGAVKITNTETQAFYPCIVLPDGKVDIGPLVDFN